MTMNKLTVPFQSHPLFKKTNKNKGNRGFVKGLDKQHKHVGTMLGVRNLRRMEVLVKNRIPIQFSNLQDRKVASY
jgi:hypothetical protein